MKSKSREYLRELQQNESHTLNSVYYQHISPKRDGFLNKKQKLRLLKKTKWEKGTTDREVVDFFYEIRERATSAIVDLKLLCDVLNENQLEKIFLKKFQYSDEKFKTFEHFQFPITELIESLLPHPIYAKKQSKEFMEKLMKERQWRKNILEDMLIEALLWYFHSGLFKTDAQKELLFDTIDAIQVNSSGKKEYDLDRLQGRMEIIKS